MKKLINEAFRLQQLAGIKPLYEGALTATDTFYLDDIEINGVMYGEIYGTMKMSTADQYSEDVDAKIVSIDGATLPNGQKIEDREQLKALLPAVLSSEEALSKVQDQAQNSTEEYGSSDRYDWDGGYDSDR
jgi:hypothetical protein